MASYDSNRAISGTRKIVRLDRLTIVTASSPALTVPVGAAPRKARVSASAAISAVVAATQRLRIPSRISFPAMMSAVLMRPLLKRGVEVVERGADDLDVRGQTRQASQHGGEFAFLTGQFQHPLGRGRPPTSRVGRVRHRTRQARQAHPIRVECPQASATRRCCRRRPCNPGSSPRRRPLILPPRRGRARTRAPSRPCCANPE